MEDIDIDELIIKTIGVKYSYLIQSELPYYRAIAQAFLGAGVKEVVEWVREMRGEEDYMDSALTQRISILLDKEAWQAKLKEWNVGD